ncbi:hypothetical protein [Halomontanus rarus]
MLVVPSPESALARAPEDASEGASESAQMDTLVEMDSHGWRVVVSEEDAE